MKRKTAELYTIRNLEGGRLATYRALSSKAAVRRFMEDQVQYASVIRRTSSVPASSVRASVETVS